jgi:hypothetical protein
MFRHRSLGIAPAAALAVWVGCGLPRPAMALAAAPESSNSALIVLPRASAVQRSSREGARLVRYRLEAEFPAAGPILDVVQRLQRRGWIPLGETTAVLRGWTSYVDVSGTTPIRIYSWWSEWTNLGGDHVSYAFRYERPEHGKAVLRSLSVAAGFYPAPLARRLREEATLSVERFAQAHPMQAAVEREAARSRTVLPARVGDAFLLSGPGGEGVVRITDTPGDQVGYRWRFRNPDGSASSGSVLEASMLAPGPYRLLWVPHVADTATAGKEGAVGYFAGVDVIPIPGEQFGTVDLAAAYALATLRPDRNRSLAAAASAALPAEADLRRDAIREAGKSQALHSGRAILVQGPKGSGVIEIVHPSLESVAYRWRFRASAGSADASGDAVASERPFPELRVGPYFLQWEMRSFGPDAAAGRAADWSADVKYLPEELSLVTIPAEDAMRLDLAAVSLTRVSR